MKKVEFGYANEQNPLGSWEGIGIRPGVTIYQADYYGAIKYKDDSYLVAKIGEEENERYPELAGRFIVRPALADLYADGSGTIFLDQQQSSVGENMERILNDERIKDRIKSVEDIMTIGEASRSPLFACLELQESLTTTSIRHEEFEKKKTRLNRCRNSMCGMREEIEDYAAQLQEAKQAQQSSGYRM